MPAPAAAIAILHAALLHRLGGEACVLPVPSESRDDLLEIGRFAGLPCWSATTSPREARAIGRRLARRGQLGLLFAEDPTTSARALMATVAPVHVAAIDPHDTNPLPLERLSRIGGGASPLATVIACADALDVDAAGRRAFADLRRALSAAVNTLPGTVPRRERHAWVLLQVTRLLFLRFVEAEGWLDGKPTFLREHADRCLDSRRELGRHFLQPLFFGTLNRSVGDRSRLARSFGAIPFLNGGLFEAHPIERRRPWLLPRASWIALLGLLVDRIEVTLDRNDRHGRVTPELLGRVFEGVMAPEQRRDTGAYFTPAPVVDALLRDAYACHLAPRLHRSEGSVLRALADPDPELQRALLSLRVIDPAVGSGAFLVGALTIQRGPAIQGVQFTRGLVTRRLFGVDRNPAAVRLTELRLWLEVLRSMRGRPAARVSPLPNLDAAIRAGDALLDPLAGHPLGSRWTRRVQRHRRGVTASHGSQRRSALKALRAAERAVMADSLVLAEARAQHRVVDLLAAARAPTLFGDRAPVNQAMQRDLADARRELQQIHTSLRQLRDDASVASFAIEAAFAPVLARGGFDLVVGNPPWVRAERLSRAARIALSGRYRWWKGSGPGWRHSPDLSVAFVERGVDLVRLGGTVAYLVPAKLATAGYATVCRSELTERTTLHRVADLANDPRAHFDATTYPLALIASRRRAAQSHQVRLALGEGGTGVEQSLWRNRPCWSLGAPDLQRLAQSLAARHPRLGDRLSAGLGVKTGANAIFVNPPKELQRWTRPAARGRDIVAFHVRPSVRLLWPADDRGEPWAKLPALLERHLSAVRSRLERRADQLRGPWWQLFRTGPATAPHRVVWPDLATDLRAAVVPDPETVPLNTCYVAVTATAEEADLLALWLNAALIRLLARATAEPARGGYARFGARTVEAVPFPDGVLTDTRLRELARQPAGERDAAVDARAAELLGIDANEWNAENTASHRR